MMDIFIFLIIEAAVVILPTLWLKKIERNENQKRMKMQQYKEWTAHWIPIQHHTTIKGEWVS